MAGEPGFSIEGATVDITSGVNWYNMTWNKVHPFNLLQRLWRVFHWPRLLVGAYICPVTVRSIISDEATKPLAKNLLVLSRGSRYGNTFEFETLASAQVPCRDAC